jgi:ABC-type uncharacterized transport system substrate-binding protein
MTIRIVVALVMLALPPLADAQPAVKVHRIGIFGDKASDPGERRFLEAFRDGLREHGWNEGANFQIEYRWAEGNPARLPELAAELVRLKPDVIVTRGSFFTGALKAATSSIPIVFVGHADPVGTGHVASLANQAETSREQRCSRPSSAPKVSSSFMRPSPRPRASPCSGTRALHLPSPA